MSPKRLMFSVIFYDRWNLKKEPFKCLKISEIILFNFLCNLNKNGLPDFYFLCKSSRLCINKMKMSSIELRLIKLEKKTFMFFPCKNYSRDGPVPMACQNVGISHCVNQDVLCFVFIIHEIFKMRNRIWIYRTDKWFSTFYNESFGLFICKFTL